MSTRATYQFISEWGRSHTAYIQDDGYPRGAVEYIEGNCTIEQFIRANEKAVMTAAHAAHGDTEYRYTIDSACVIAHRKSTNYSTGKDTWICIFSGPMEAFAEWCKK